MEPISGALLGAAASATAGPIFNLVTKFGSDVYDQWASQFQESFQGHIDATAARCGKMKNILYRDQSVDFESQYVNITLGLNDQPVSDLDALKLAQGGEKILIYGTAGAGKTMFMRWSTLTSIREMSKFGRIPLYLEMRYFDSDFTDKQLEEYIHAKTSSVSNQASLKQFKLGLESGLFLICLDAIDEIAPDIREKVVGRIIDFINGYPLCGLLISSRFDEKLESIQELTVLRSMPMNLDQIVCVIERLEYDKDVKDKLVVRLRDGLYEQLEEFLSNPLLATIMLLTFDHSADIPTKLTEFYKQAFEALYQRHDSAKGAYKRDHHAGLPIDRYRTVFAAFSFQTYLDFKFEFSDDELISSVREACDYVGEDADPALIVRDSMESVCLIQRDGLFNIYSHRSFQEYFSALFIANYREDNVRALIEAVASAERNSNILKMLYELSPEMFEYEWVLPLLDRFMNDLGRVNPRTKSGLSKMLGMMYSQISVDAETHEVRLISWPMGGSVSESKFGRWMSVIHSSTGEVSLHHAIFENPIWPGLQEFHQTLPKEAAAVAGDLPSRVEPYGPNGEPVVRLDATDAAWLVHSALPERLIAIRQEVKRYRGEIVERREARKSSVARLIGKPLSSRRRTRGR